MSPSALSKALFPADSREPVTVMSESAPAPLAMTVRSLPAAMLEPTEDVVLRVVVVWVLLLP